jgi:hypothetical protein
MNNNEKLRNDFQALSIDDLKYYGRRVETVSLIICGFGLYGNFELLKYFEGANNCSNWCLFLSAVLLLIAVFILLKCLILERNVRALYIQLLSGIKANGVNPSEESLKLEDKIISRNRNAYRLMVIAFVFSITAIGIFFFNK